MPSQILKIWMFLKSHSLAELEPSFFFTTCKSCCQSNSRWCDPLDHTTLQKKNRIAIKHTDVTTYCVTLKCDCALPKQEAHQLRDGLEGVELQYERDDGAEELVNVLMRVAYDKEQQVDGQEQTP